MCNLLLLRVVGWQGATNRKTSFVSINKMHLKVTSISAKSSFVPVATNNIALPRRFRLSGFDDLYTYVGRLIILKHFEKEEILLKK